MALEQGLREALEEITSHADQGLAVMLLTLEGFREVTDTLGHQQGDLLLREVAGRLTDGAGSEALVSRFGGAEFAILVPHRLEPDAAVSFGRRLLNALERPIVIDGIAVHVGASVGIALAPEHATNAAALLRQADVAMYAAKASATGVWVYELTSDTSSPRRLALRGELREAIEREELAVYVQPKASLQTGEVCSVEALARWVHPAHGFVPPDEFIPVAERSGLIGPLTKTVLSQSLAACAAWRNAGREVGIAVNLSARSLVDADLAEEVAALLARYQLPARLLTLEITESSIMSDPAKTNDLLCRLDDMGIRLSIDDFGTGYSSLAYLKRLPVREVKVDRSFVTNMDSDADDAAIVRSIVDLATALSLEVVAEGVENEAAWTRLAALGCTTVQGYYLGRPMPAAEFPDWLSTYDGGRRAAMSALGTTVAAAALEPA